MRVVPRTLHTTETRAFANRVEALTSVIHRGTLVAIHASVFRQLLEAEPDWLSQLRRGVEKESLRVSKTDATLAQTAHPRGLGSALTHSSITTDYSEALLEFITPASSSIEATVEALRALHSFTAQQLDGEQLWSASMPCIVHGDAGIPIAEFGSSNVGKMKRVYRNGLSVRYGRRMQAIAGIHYNFSLPKAFWTAAHELSANAQTRQAFQTEGYLALIRNFFSRVWLLLYLLGASPAVCASFVQGNKNHPLKPLGDDHHSFYLPHATSLRMGDLGYTSNAQAGMAVCYNDIEQYIRTLREAILTPHKPYANFRTMDNGERAQLNASLLQIENEYYSPIRPKRVTQTGEAPVVALALGGIEYVEVRCIDINPFLPLGIDADTMRLLDLFLLACLIDDSPLCDERGQQQNKINMERIINRGRDPALTLLAANNNEVTMEDSALPIISRMEEIAGWFEEAPGSGGNYTRVVADAHNKVMDPSMTYSARILSEMDSGGCSFWQLAKRYSSQWHNEHLSYSMPRSELTKLEDEARLSLKRQQDLESQEQPPFDEYLAQFYSQYR